MNVGSYTGRICSIKENVVNEGNQRSRCVRDPKRGRIKDEKESEEPIKELVSCR